MDCFGTYFTHVQTCNVTRVQSATEWTASVHTLHMSKPVMQPVFKVLRNGLLRYILYTCPNLECNPCSKCYGMHMVVHTFFFLHCRTSARHCRSTTGKSEERKQISPKAKANKNKTHQPNKATPTKAKPGKDPGKFAN